MDFFSGFFDGLTADKLLTATREAQQARYDQRMREMMYQAQLNAIPSRLGNPNASSNPASQVEASSWVKNPLVIAALLAVAGVVVWKVMK